jgi:hypothetical protein
MMKKKLKTKIAFVTTLTNGFLFTNMKMKKRAITKIIPIDSVNLLSNTILSNIK